MTVIHTRSSQNNGQRFPLEQNGLTFSRFHGRATCFQKGQKGTIWPHRERPATLSPPTPLPKRSLRKELIFEVPGWCPIQRARKKIPPSKGPFAEGVGRLCWIKPELQGWEYFLGPQTMLVPDAQRLRTLRTGGSPVDPSEWGTQTPLKNRRPKN